MFKTYGEAKAAGFELWTCPECTASCTFETMNLCHGDDCPAKRTGIEVKALQDMFELVARRTT